MRAIPPGRRPDRPLRPRNHNTYPGKLTSMRSEIPSLPSLDAAQPGFWLCASPVPLSSWRRPSAIIAALGSGLARRYRVETRSRMADLQEELGPPPGPPRLQRRLRSPSPRLPGRGRNCTVRRRPWRPAFSETQASRCPEAAYQEFSRTRDDRVLSEVEQAITPPCSSSSWLATCITHWLKLQTADARLASVERPSGYSCARLSPKT